MCHELKKGQRKMEKEIEKIFNRQFERMKGELLAINMPQGYLTIISKYWDFAKQDVEERIKGDAVQTESKNNNR